MRAAVVDQNGIVVNVIEVADLATAAATCPGYTVLQRDDLSPGWRLVDGEFVPPEPEPEPLWEEMPTHLFLAGLTGAEMRRFDQARATDDHIYGLLRILDVSQTVHRDHPLLRQGLQYAASIGLIESGRVVELIGAQ